MSDNPDGRQTCSKAVARRLPRLKLTTACSPNWFPPIICTLHPESDIALPVDGSTEHAAVTIDELLLWGRDVTA